MNQIIVVKARNIFIITIFITFLLILSLFGNSIVTNVIEVSASNRLIPIYSVETSEKNISLTFDCAWGADDIDDIISTLTNNNVKATFFTVGTWVEKYPEVVKKLHDAGMTISNHSYNHSHVAQLSLEENIKDMQKCNARIEEITNEKVKFYRGAYGEYSNDVITAAENEGMKTIQWSIDVLDYLGKTPDEMCDKIKSKIRNGSIVLMHNDTDYTAKGLQQIIDTIKELGYEIVPLDELIYHENYTINHEGRQILSK